LSAIVFHPFIAPVRALYFSLAKPTLSG